MPTNGPYSWGKGPEPKPKGIIAKLIKKAIDLATEDRKGK